MTTKKPLWQAVCDVLAVPAFWLVQYLRPPMPRRRIAGFNPVVDERRELTIRMKVGRGQHYITKPDAEFLLARLDDLRRRV